MEADKPDWYDALNGLPGLMGSSISETLEIKRHILFLLDTFQKLKLDTQELLIFEELSEFMITLHSLLRANLTSFEFWNQAATARELYREKTRLGICGAEIPITISEIRDFFALCLKKLNEGIAKAWNKEKNIISTYFINQVTDYQEIELALPGKKTELKRNPKGLVCFRALSFRQIPLPLFLEGPVHYLRCLPSQEEALKLVKNIRKSDLYDKNLQMYKVNASLADQPMEIGRARTFSPGWFENESIWLHMEYKYMLELLRNKLYFEFYQDFTNVFVPFFKPEIYGRSILENSSFIVCSANPDPSIHGNGFVARLSGATAEFIHILSVMTFGQEPFQINANGELKLSFSPALADWLFTKKVRKSLLFWDNKWQEIEFPAKTFSFMFLGNILVTYHNPDLKNTFGADQVSPSSWKVTYPDGRTLKFKSRTLSGTVAEEARSRKISRIDIELK